MACIICLLIILPKSGHAGTGFSYFWVRVLDGSNMPISNAQVIARDTRNGDTYILRFRGWGYYNKTLEPGSYDIIINGKFVRSAVYASSYWYVITTCYI